MEEIKFTNGLIIRLPDVANLNEQLGAMDDTLNTIVSYFMSAERELIKQVLTQVLDREPNVYDLSLCSFERILPNKYRFFYDGVEIGIINGKEPNPLTYSYDIVFTPHPAFC